ncbi:hypothetical protein AAHA92_17888 [Salvia divinorum]|uniref:Uncharacterized protein n=1 Tax=Salvia divinorum TaxID=28513 RepID=A0ABD1H4B4_SALDI
MRRCHDRETERKRRRNLTRRRERISEMISSRKLGLLRQILVDLHSCIVGVSFLLLLLLTIFLYISTVHTINEL